MRGGSLRLQFHRSLFGGFIALNHRPHLKLVHFEVIRKFILAFVVLNMAKVITTDLSLNYNLSLSRYSFKFAVHKNKSGVGVFALMKLLLPMLVARQLLLLRLKVHELTHLLYLQ